MKIKILEFEEKATIKRVTLNTIIADPKLRTLYKWKRLRGKIIMRQIIKICRIRYYKVITTRKINKMNKINLIKLTYATHRYGMQDLHRDNSPATQ